MNLPDPLPGHRRVLNGEAGRIALYADGPEQGPADATPLVLIHSVNAAGSAYEVRPLYLHYRSRRPVYALDLPGFGHSDRPARRYTPALMRDAILQVVAEARRAHGGAPVDALAVSLGSEFLAKAARLRPDDFRTLALVSPTGFDRRDRSGPPDSTKGMAWLYGTFTFPLWREAFFRLLTSRASIRFFLEKTWGSKAIDEGLLDFDYLATHQPGAHHAPYDFVSGYLFSADIHAVYDALEHPVFMLHGDRGDFTDYRRTARFVGRPNWTIHPLKTGALPHFEVPDQVTALYDAFLANAAAAPRAAVAAAGQA